MNDAAADAAHTETSAIFRRESGRALAVLVRSIGDISLAEESVQDAFTTALASEARVALTLRLLGGLTTAEIARSFLVSESTLGQRMSRAKAKIRDAGIAYRVPDVAELPERLRSALAVVYLIFN